MYSRTLIHNDVLGCSDAFSASPSPPFGSPAKNLLLGVTPAGENEAPVLTESLSTALT